MKTRKSPSGAEREEVHPADRAEWRSWLEANHASSSGIWLVYDRKSSRPDRLAYAAAVEEALCFGWIDSTVRPIDEARYKQLYTPRKPKSVWSKVNKERIERLTAQGLMTAAGLAAIEVARSNGSWEALDAVEAFVVPTELAEALAAAPAAKSNFEAFSPSTRKGYLHWLNSAKRPETRAVRIAEIVELAAANRRTRFPTG